MKIISINNSRLTNLYMYLLLETLDEPKMLTQKEILLSIGFSSRSEGSLKRMTNKLIDMGFLKIKKFKDERGINRIEYKAQ